MKRFIAIILASVLALSGCVQQTAIPKVEDNTVILTQENIPEFNDLGDQKLLQYVEDTVYAGLVDQFSNEDYIIENVSAIYYSKEYLEELAYNSKSNIFFGYTLEELDKLFQGTRYVFTLSDKGETSVLPFEVYDETYDEVIKNVAIGTGVIMVCVTVSVISGGVGAPVVSIIFAASAKTGTAVALSSGVISGVAAGVVTGIQTKDFDEAVKAATLTGSESFKWGAITGALAGGLSKANALRNASAAAKAIPTPEVAEEVAFEYYGGSSKCTTQVSYLGGEKVPYSTPGSTRPDIIRKVGNHIEAIEVKNYDLGISENRSALYNELKRQISARVKDLPAGSTQRISLNVQGRNYTEKLITDVIKDIKNTLQVVYPNISIDILR